MILGRTKSIFAADPLPLLLLQLLLLLAAASLASAIPDRPKISNRARVKQHRFGATGQLVAGEEELRKIIVYWPPTVGALGYEICHNCSVDDATGVRSDENDGGVATAIAKGDTCGGTMCGVFPGAPFGKNRFNVRVQTSEGWSLWSKHANFVVGEAGFSEHEHDEL
jgi:hypothetical protein